MINLLFELCIEDLPASKIENFLKILIKNFYKNTNSYNVCFLKFRIFFTNRRISIIVLDVFSKQKKIVLVPSVQQNNIDIFLSVLLKLEKLYIRCMKVIVSFNGLFLFSNGKLIRCKVLINLFAQSIAKTLLNLIQDDSMAWSIHVKNFIRPVYFFNFVCDTFCVNYKFFGICGNLRVVSNKFKKIQKFFLKPKEYEKNLEIFSFVIPCFYKRVELLRRKLNFILFNKYIKIQSNNNLLIENSSFFEYPINFFGSFCITTDCISNYIFLCSVQKKTKSFVFFFIDNYYYYFIITINVVKNVSRKIFSENRIVLLEHLDEIVRLTKLDREIFFHYKIIGLKNVIFFDCLGNFFEKIKRIYFLSLMFITNKIYVCSDNILEGSLFCKLDNCSYLISEYPDLKGIAGKFYALYSNINVDVAFSIEEYYLPKKQFLNVASIPRTNLGVILAVTDRLDDVVSLFRYRKNNVNNDLFGLRRQILSVVNITILNLIDVDIFLFICYAAMLCKQNSFKFLLNVFLFINERIFFMYKKLGYIKNLSCLFYLGYPVRYPYDFHKKITDRILYVNIYKICRINFIKRRLNNILLLKNCKYSDLNMLTSLTFYDIKLFLFTKNILINLEYLLHVKLYFCIYEIINILWYVLDNFFKYNFINIKNIKLKNNRLELLNNVYIILSNCVKSKLF